MRPAPRIPRIVAKPQRKPDPRRNAQHLAYIRQLPCMGCGANLLPGTKTAQIEAAHIRKGTNAGVGMKPADRFVVPLCGGLAGCHARQHKVGELTFWGNLGVDPVDVASRLWTVSGDIEAGRRIVFRARQMIALKTANSK